MNNIDLSAALNSDIIQRIDGIAIPAAYVDRSAFKDYLFCEAIAAMSLSLALITSSAPLPLNVRSPQDTMLPSTLLLPVNSIVACE